MKVVKEFLALDRLHEELCNSSHPRYDCPDCDGLSFGKTVGAAKTNGFVFVRCCVGRVLTWGNYEFYDETEEHGLYGDIDNARVYDETFDSQIITGMALVCDPIYTYHFVPVTVEYVKTVKLERTAIYPQR